MLSRRQVTVQRDNLIAICRISVKCLLDYASLYTHVNDDSEEFINFCAVFEQLVSHRLQPTQKKTWLRGQGSPRHFWDVLVDNYHRTRGFLYQSCIPNIESIETLKSPKAKLRAFIRVALMEKRLSDYLSWVRENKYLMRESYLDGAFMTSEEAVLLFGELIGLNAIDFNFCLKGSEDELLGPLEISYSPFLSYKQSSASQCSDEIEMLRLSGKDVEELRDTSSVLMESNMNDVLRVHNLEKDMRQIKEQKDYLEELLRLRERQLSEASIRLQNANIEWQRVERSREQERLTMEACILELQKEMSKLQKTNDSLKAQVSAFKQYKQRTEVKEGPMSEVAIHVQMDSVLSRCSLPQVFSEQPSAAEDPSMVDRLSSPTKESQSQEEHQAVAQLGTESNPNTNKAEHSQHTQQLFPPQKERTLQANSALKPEDDQATLKHSLQLEVKEHVSQTSALVHPLDLNANEQILHSSATQHPVNLDLKDQVPSYEIHSLATSLDKSENFLVIEQAESANHVPTQEKSADSVELATNHSNSNSSSFPQAKHGSSILCNENSSSAEFQLELPQGKPSNSSALGTLSLDGTGRSFLAVLDDSSIGGEYKQEQVKLEQEQFKQEQELFEKEQFKLEQEQFKQEQFKQGQERFEQEQFKQEQKQFEQEQFKQEQEQFEQEQFKQEQERFEQQQFKLEQERFEQEQFKLEQEQFKHE